MVNQQRILSTAVTSLTIILTFHNLLIADCQNVGAKHQRNYNRAKVLRGDQHPPPDSEFDFGNTEEIHPLTDTTSYWRTKHKGSYFPQRQHPCDESSCYPQTGNLLIGRKHQLYASSTCGLNGPERYCIVSHLQDRKKCFWCDSRPSQYPKPDVNHNISNIIYRVYPGTKQKTWWQSDNGKENVYIQLDLEAEFHFTHIIITFKTFRPAAMLIERSYDFKKTWHVYRYFAHNCEESFPGVLTEPPRNLTDIVCESKYSNVAPSTDGEIIYRVLLPHYRVDNPYSHQVQNLLKVTNLRINFTKLHTLGDDLLDRREEIQEKYYYAITDMVVRGSCSCYGHASQCLPLPDVVLEVDMVHGRCECTHNTKGRNCEKCEDFFNDLPWGPAVGKHTNACKRCNCNNHATSCHFDPAVYAASGQVSGGVCDGCKHNTMGQNCEQCKSFFYRDPTKDIQDPEVCRPCDCDPYGSLDSGICDSITDQSNNLVAGACHCKQNVEGRRCDVCKNGFWNFSPDNPEGCQPCTCNTLGTIDNQGCNVYNGECTCKRYVIGRDCNQCLPEYWGLSEKRDGCDPCDCDPGGSYDNQCDVVNGQCKCREHMTGRNCSVPIQQHFTASLDFLVYEAELAKSSPNCQVVIREPYRDGREDTWTGTGFVKAFEGSTIDFNVDNIRRSMDYDIVVRYEMPYDNWDDATVTIIRPSPPDPNGPCKDVRLEDDVKQIALSGRGRSIIAYPPTCLEEGIPYTIQIHFRRSHYDRESPSASVLIDSVVLLPKVESIPWYSGSPPAEARRRVVESHRCFESSHDANRNQVSEVCKDLSNSITAYVFNGAISCQCDPTGSVSKLCSEHGGFCTCKPNVVGRRCDRCAPGTYGFGPEGCIACDCNSIGSLDNFCNATTGQCDCRENTYGRQCDQCQIGFWKFPNCQRCDCNGHADTCNAMTGECDECRDNTQGHTCDHCVDGYYGDPRLNVDIPCRPCPCPGIPGSGHSYASKCALDEHTRDVVCECKIGYSGERCDVCADNYFGNPEEPGGLCQLCDCNDKINLLAPGNCDPKSGQCKQCLYDTTGDHCEICKPGFFRNFDSDICAPCVCHLLGTNSSAGFCDHNSGQCPCFPNVLGNECDQCAPNHWKIASGSGCESCDCDPLGSTDLQCNLFDGQCSCKPNYGGRQCNECRANHWGNPKQNECHECTCDIYGSATTQCDHKTGACVCRTGIGGYKCDKCAKGYVGEATNCSPCGECFDNWDRILGEHRNRTDDVIERAKNIKKVGATGAYTKEFHDMEQKLDDIEKLLNNTEKIDLDEIDRRSKELDGKVKEINNGMLKQLGESLANATQGNQINDINFKQIQDKLFQLQNKTKELEQNRTLLQQANVQGALALIQEAKNKALKAGAKAEHSQSDVTYASQQCKAVDNLIDTIKNVYDKRHKDDEKALEEISEKITNLRLSFPEMNNLVCDRHGDPCDSICGGAGCAICGDALTCEKGAKQQALNTFRLANETEVKLKDIAARADDFIRNVSLVNTSESKLQAQRAHNSTKDLFEKSNRTIVEMESMKNQIEEFLHQNHTSPDDIKKMIEDVRKLKISRTPEEIKELSKEIKNILKTLTNTDAIIEDTKDDLNVVNNLKEKAVIAKNRSDAINARTQEVKEILRNTTVERVDAENAATQVYEIVKEIEEMLEKTEAKTNLSVIAINKTNANITAINANINNLRLEATKNEQNAQEFRLEAANIKSEAKKTHETLQSLKEKYNKTKTQLDRTVVKVEQVKEKANELVERAIKLTATINKNEEDIKKMKLTPENELEELDKNLRKLILRMDEYNDIIKKKADYYKNCT